jgi:glycosyltransferase involved in cell wall biosynthesis
MPQPQVGVVIPTHDGERHLGEAIESVLGQTHRPLDVVVADDGSTDATREVARGYAPEVRCIALPHRGLGATRNAGIRCVRGEYVAFLDQDDLWPRQKLELQLDRFAAERSLDLVFGAVREFTSPELAPRLARRVRCVSRPRPAALPGTIGLEVQFAAVLQFPFPPPPSHVFPA